MPMNRKLYPKNWNAIALAIKTEVNWTCENCGRPCRRPGESDGELEDRIYNEHAQWWDDLWETEDDEEFGEAEHMKPVRFTLTVAHLDHQPENCDRSNLRAWCSVTTPCYTCQHCSAHFEAKRSAVYCSPACKQAAWRKKRQPVGSQPDNDLLDRLVDETLERCKEQGLDPKDLVLHLQLQKIKALLSRFDEKRQKQFVMQLVSWVFEEGEENA
jgi:hypothetical protein